MQMKRICCHPTPVLAHAPHMPLTIHVPPALTAQTKHFFNFQMRGTEYLKVREARVIAQRTKWPRDLPGFKPGPFAFQANALPTESRVPVRGVWRLNPTYSIDTFTASNTSPSTAHAPYTVRLIISRKSFWRKGDGRIFIESGKFPVHTKGAKLHNGSLFSFLFLVLAHSEQN